ncbi:cellulase family glycosylhydrolase [Termitidicoccus mucosus]|uniref:Ig-like domain-containing protein n=1 Tax=Termitidicoccus mucosus TaxID=1184151 RepID=A0A178IMU4_9BACT|nr:hypothetical protein AW736_04185 [Opitutaceae bacterium TSB47]
MNTRHTSTVGRRILPFVVMSAVTCALASPILRATVVFNDTAENKDNWVDNYPSGGGAASFARFIATGGEFQYTGGNTETNLVAGTSEFFSANDNLELSFDGFFATASNGSALIVDIGLATNAIATANVKLGLKFTASGSNAKLVYNNTEYSLAGNRPVAGSAANGKASIKIAYQIDGGGTVTVTQLAGTYLPAGSSTATAVPPGGVVLYNGSPSGSPIDFGTGLRIRLVGRNSGSGGITTPVTIDNIKLAMDEGGGDGVTSSWPAAAQRGVNAGNWLTSYEMGQTLAPWGTKLMRLQLLGSAPQFTPEQDGVSGEWTFPTAGWTAIDTFLTAAKSNNMKVVLDLHGCSHFFPNSNYNTWSQEPGAPGIANKNKLVSLWKTIATRYKDERDAIAGYEILNEPIAGGDLDKENGAAPLDGADAWNTILTEVIAAIRAIDTYHAVVVEPVGYANQAYLKRLKYFDPSTTPGIVYSVHIYSPHEYAEQGTVSIQPPWKFGFDGIIVNGTAVGSGYYYPGLVDFVTKYTVPYEYETTVLDKDYLRTRVAPILEFQNQHKGARIYVGEFGAVRHAPINLAGQDSTWTFLRDYLSLFYNDTPSVSHPHWDWTIHAFQFSANDLYTGLQYDNIKESTTRHADTNKIRLYKHYLNPENDTVAPPEYVDTLPDAAIPETPPPTPYGLTATAPGSGQVELAWIPSSRAEKYKICYSTSGSGGPFAELAVVDQPSAAALASGSYTMGYIDGEDSPLPTDAVYYYTVSATNAHGESAPSAPAGVTVSGVYIPVINEQPQSVSPPLGVSATLSVTLKSTVGVTGYQWSKDGQPVVSGTNATLVLAGTPADAGVYTVTITGLDGPAVSTSATVTIQPDAASLFNTPVALAATDAGEIHVADSTRHIVQTLKTDNTVYTFLGAPGSTGAVDNSGTHARLNAPSGLAVCSGTLYIADTGNNSLRASGVGGSLKTIAIALNRPAGLAADSAGNVYMADRDNHQIRKFAPGGAVSLVAGSGTAGHADAAGALASFKSPAGLALFETGGTDGYLYVVDTGNHALRVITLATGSVTTFSGAPGEPAGHADATGTNARFDSPGGLVVDADGDLYLADTGNSVIRKITPTGVVITLAGAPGHAGFKDATGTNAWFDHPRDITLTATGTLVVADTGNRALRAISAADAVTTLVVTSGTAPTLDPPASAVPEIPPFNPPQGKRGGGAPSWWLVTALAVLLAARAFASRHLHGTRFQRIGG